MIRSIRSVRENIPLVAFYLSYPIGLALLLFSFYLGETKLWDGNGSSIISSPFIAATFGFVIIAVWHSKLLLQKTLGRNNLLPFAALLILVFASNWFSFSYSLYPGLSFRGEILLFSGIGLAALHFRAKNLFPIWALLSSIILIFTFLTAADGRLIFTDDHPSVLYRLQLLKENFPFIPFYNPDWNAGSDARDFFATGILNVFIIFLPLIYAFPIEAVYNFIVLGICFALLPLSTYAAARVSGQSKPTAAIAATLSLSCCTLWYRWALSYGAIGFVASGALLPLSYYLAVKLLSPNQLFSRNEAVLLVITFSLMLCWSLSALVFIPLLVIIPWRRIFQIPYLSKTALAIAVLNIPWIIIFVVVSNVFDFTQLEKAADVENNGRETVTEYQPAHTEAAVKGKAKDFSVTKSLKILREASVKTNPLILFLALPGIFLLFNRTLRIALLLSAAWLIFLGTIYAPVKPQLELERMLLFLCLLLTVPTAKALEQLWDTTVEKAKSQQFVFAKLILTALCIGFLLSSTFATGFIVRNRSIERYTFAQPIVNNISSTIREHGGPGRTLFSSFILHQLSAGHIAPLAYFSGHQLIASSPVHNLWWFTDVIPAEFRERKEEGVEEFLNLMNVTSVVAFDKVWRDYFAARPEKYEKLWQEGSFIFFKRHYPENSYFLSGSGELIQQESDAVTVKLSSSEAVLKFTYFPFLTSSACDIKAANYGKNVQLISLTNCPPNATVTISSISAFSRVLQSVFGVGK